VVPSKKRAVIFGEPICWRCWATDLNRKERGKVVPSKRLRRSPCEPDFPGCLKGERARPGGHEENWFLRKKVLAPAGGPDSWISV
jgi:hypothetical protein